MPWFTYRCPVCETEWDERRSRSDPHLDLAQEHCPNNCDDRNGEAGRRVPFASVPAIYFHGRGWSRVDKNYAPNGDMLP